MAWHRVTEAWPVDATCARGPELLKFNLSKHEATRFRTIGMAQNYASLAGRSRAPVRCGAVHVFPVEATPAAHMPDAATADCRRHVRWSRAAPAQPVEASLAAHQWDAPELFKPGLRSKAAHANPPQLLMLRTCLARTAKTV